MKKLSFLLLSIAFAIFILDGQARAVPDIRGKYSGTYSIVVSNCTNSSSIGTYNAVLEMKISTQNGNTFSGTATSNSSPWKKLLYLLVQFRNCSEDPAYDFDANVVGTRNVIEAVRRTGAGPLVFTSSAAVYGEPIRAPMPEDHPLHPKSPYGGTKLAAEFLLESYSRCFDLDHRRLRLFNTYGPRQSKYAVSTVGIPGHRRSYSFQVGKEHRGDGGVVLN